MEYAVQTRDYNHDYRWSWEESGSDSLRAKVSLELQNLIEDGKPGVAVIFREGSYHVIITAIYKLGDKPIGTDFSSANIRLNLVFSQITLKKAKGIVRYYLENQSNPGAAFSNIVTWSNTRDKWTINEERIIDAFNSIQEGSESGMVLNCEKGSELQSLLDFDWGQTEGAKYVYQPKSSNPVRIAVDPIPEKPLPPPEPPKKTYGKLASLLFMLLLITTGVAIWAGFEWYRCYKANDNISQLESEVQKAKSAQKNAEQERAKAVADKENAEKERAQAVADKENVEQERAQAVADKEEAKSAHQQAKIELDAIKSTNEAYRKAKELAEEERDKATAEKNHIQQLNDLFNKYGITVNDNLKTITISNGDIIELIELKGNNNITIIGDFPITEGYNNMNQVQGTIYNVTKIMVKRKPNNPPSPNVNP